MIYIVYLLTERRNKSHSYHLLLGKRRYNIKLWKTFTDCFNCLPVAAIIDEKIFCCHGGLSPDLQSMEQVQFNLPSDPPPKSARAFTTFHAASFHFKIYTFDCNLFERDFVDSTHNAPNRRT